MKIKIYIFSAICLFSLFVFIYPFSHRDEKGIPVQFGGGNKPFIEVRIQKEVFPVLIDTGSFSQLEINKDILSKIDKKPYGKRSYHDFRKNNYSSPQYLIPKIQIGFLNFSEVLTNELQLDFYKNIVFWHQKCEKDENISLSTEKYGSIGRGLLKRKNLFLDFPNSRIFLTNNVKIIETAGYFSNRFIKTPFKMTRFGIALNIETSAGDKTFILDTGAGATVIRSNFLTQENSIWDSEKSVFKLPASKFEINGSTFKTMDVYFMDISEDLSEIDGLLGMDFLKNHPIYIDFQEKMLFIGNSLETSN